MWKERETPTWDALSKQYDKPKDGSVEEATTKQANLTITEDDQSTVTVSVPEQMFLDHFDSLSTTRQISTVRTVRAHLEYVELFRNCNLFFTEATDQTIVDSGADTSIVGNGWYVVSYTQRTTNLLGYDPTSTQLDGLPMVSAVTMVTLPSRTPVMVRINEAVYNKGSSTSLLSEFQSRDFGAKIDTVSRRHVNIDGHHGRQVIEMISGVKIPLFLRHCLMAFEHHLPTEEELNSCKAIDLTDHLPWDPSKFHDDDISVLASGGIQGIMGETCDIILLTLQLHRFMHRQWN